MPEGEPTEDDEAGGQGAGEAAGEDGDARLLVEGMLFSAGKALRVVDIEEATGLPRREVTRALRRLSTDYRRRSSALEVVKAGSRWTMQVREEYTNKVRAVAAPEVHPRLLRTLALIAYHQPLLQSDLQEMMGPRVYEHVRELVNLGLVSASRKGATKQLTTTQRFPEYFGISSAKREDIKRFLAERVGLAIPPVPSQEAGAGVEEGQEDGGEVKGGQEDAQETAQEDAPGETATPGADAEDLEP